MYQLCILGLVRGSFVKNAEERSWKYSSSSRRRRRGTVGDFISRNLPIYCNRGKKMPAHKIAHATLKGPNVVKEICIGLTLGLLAGGLWKMHHWNEQKKARALYDMLEKGQISVAVPEE
ncbi:cytochrome c oxidase subunit 5C-like [Typha angustifolia]|uniref:cytochrome c oxidase subunit 5C-like n=1 Tax=Typha angustifolia TaxID=59011 RepID=UPI003C2FBF83